MGQWALSPSQSARTPRSLADRLASEVRTEIREEAKPGGEATVSSMAERFAPEGKCWGNQPLAELCTPSCERGLGVLEESYALDCGVSP